MRGGMGMVHEWRYLRSSWSRVQLGRRTKGEHIGLIWEVAWTEGDLVCRELEMEYLHNLRRCALKAFMDCCVARTKGPNSILVERRGAALCTFYKCTVHIMYNLSHLCVQSTL
jgi:hypothetical protein